MVVFCAQPTLSYTPPSKRKAAPLAAPTSTGILSCKAKTMWSWREGDYVIPPPSYVTVDEETLTWNVASTETAPSRIRQPGSDSIYYGMTRAILTIAWRKNKCPPAWQTPNELVIYDEKGRRVMFDEWEDEKVDTYQHARILISHYNPTTNQLEHTIVHKGYGAVCENILIRGLDSWVLPQI